MPLCIMIVEDELLLSMDLEDILIEAGHIVAGSAMDMYEALGIAERMGDRIDIAIMDVHLAKGTNGVETAEILRSRWDIPCLFVSGNLDEATRAKALEWRPLGFVGKPFSPREVLEALHRLEPATP